MTSNITRCTHLSLFFHKTSFSYFLLCSSFLIYVVNILSYAQWSSVLPQTLSPTSLLLALLTLPSLLIASVGVPLTKQSLFIKSILCFLVTIVFSAFFWATRLNPFINFLPYYYVDLMPNITSSNKTSQRNEEWEFTAKNAEQLDYSEFDKLIIQVYPSHQAYFTPAQNPQQTLTDFLYFYWPQPFPLTHTQDTHVFDCRFSYILRNNYLQILEFDRLRIQFTSYGAKISYPWANDINSQDIVYSHALPTIYQLRVHSTPRQTKIFFDKQLVFSKQLTFKKSNLHLGDSIADNEHDGALIIYSATYSRYHTLENETTP